MNACSEKGPSFYEWKHNQPCSREGRQMPCDQRVRNKAIVVPHSVTCGARATAWVGQLPHHGHPSHARPASQSAWLPSAAGLSTVGCRTSAPRLRHLAIATGQSVQCGARAEEHVRWLAPAVVVLQGYPPSCAAGPRQGLFSREGVHNSTQPSTRRFSGRSRAAHPLLVSSWAWLRTVSRKGRATRPAAERERCTYLARKADY